MSTENDSIRIIAEIDSHGSHYLFKIADDLQKMPDFEGEDLDYLASLVLSSIIDYWCLAEMDELSYILGACDEYDDQEVGRRTKRNIMDLSKADLDDFPDFYNTKLTLIDMAHEQEQKGWKKYRFTEPEVNPNRKYFVVWMEYVPE